MDETGKNLWPGWETVGVLGHGSYGTVYKIQRQIFDEVESAALKVISIPKSEGDVDELINDGYDQESISSTFRDHMKSIVSEYSLMRKMNGSANIVNCDDVRYVQHPDGIGWDIYIKMELLTPLPKALGAKLDEKTVITVGKDMCAALMLCKKHDIVHRDIKPPNIFLSHNGDYKLGDFGIAKTIEKTMGGTKAGTYKYMSPEVFNNQPYGSGADIYSLGIVLYWLLNERRTPFLPLPPATPTNTEEEKSRQRRFAEQLPPPKHGSAALKQIVLKACAFKPEDRYQSAEEMYNAFAALESGAAVGGKKPEKAENKTPVEADDETVGPVFEKKPEKKAEKKTEKTADNDEGTVGPDWKNVKKPEKPPKPAKKKKRPIWLIGVLIVAVVLFLFTRSCDMEDWLPGSTEPNGDVVTEPTEPQDNTEPSDPLPTDPAPSDPDIPPTTPGETEPSVTTPPATEIPKIAVPFVKGKTQEEAKAELEQLGFAVELQYIKSENMPEGSVIEQEPQSGTQLEKGSKVILQISSGKPTIFVADVTGKTLSEAEALLTAQGFLVSFEEEYSASAQKGKVFAQSPSAGSGQFSGTTIVLTISKGPEPMELVFDPTGGTTTEQNRTVYCGVAFGALPTAERKGFAFKGWYFANGTKVSADTVVTEAGDLRVYAEWTPVAYTVKWNAGTGYTIKVSRSSSPNAGASTGSLSSGATVYYGDVLSVTYTANTGYTISSKGSTSITVTGNVTSSHIYATATANSFKANWNTGTGYTIKVSRTSSPNAGASTGSLSSGATVYYGDVLSVTYTANTGYTISSKGSTSITVTGNVTSSHIYATATANSFKANWNTGTGYTIKVSRTSSPNAGASTGSLSSGATVYYGDVLSVTYTANTGYTISSKGSTSITVTGNVTSSQIYATATANSFKANWNTGTGYTIKVSRTSSPNAGASTGSLSSGATVYYGDVLSVTYTANTGYTISSKGSTSITVTGNVTSSHIYATATANSFKANWNTGTGYTIKVSRTSSPNAGASTGSLSSGATVYYGDVLSVTYTANTGYTISSKGSTSITVTGNVTSSQIYATVSANKYTYNVVYKSANGTSLGSATVTYPYGTTNTITPLAISGYMTPSSQNVTWDSTSAKTITFSYIPYAASNATKQGYISNSQGYKLAYSVTFEYCNRTATSVQVRLVWTTSLSGNGAYNAYGQRFKATFGSVSTGAVAISSYGTWKNASSSTRSVSASSGWVTVPLNTTNATTVNCNVYYYQVNSNGTDMTKHYGVDGLNTNWSFNVPAY